jgi:hypothetical protein
MVGGDDHRARRVEAVGVEEGLTRRQPEGRAADRADEGVEGVGHAQGTLASSMWNSVRRRA